MLKPTLEGDKLLSDAQFSELCVAIVHAHRLGLNGDYTLERISGLLNAKAAAILPDLRGGGAAAAAAAAEAERAQRAQRADSTTTGSGKWSLSGGKWIAGGSRGAGTWGGRSLMGATSRKPPYATDPLKWLQGVVMGSTRCCELGERLDGWLSTATASYLDPFLDGDVPEREYTQRSTGLFIERLRARASDVASGGIGAAEAARLRPEHYVGAYVRHAISKLNANLGFGPHIPGIGRQPVTVHEQSRHLSRLSHALVDALGRDFAEEHRQLRGITLSAALFEDLGAAHLGACVCYEQELGNALAVANREGEEARRFERLRIWGYC